MQYPDVKWSDPPITWSPHHTYHGRSTQVDGRLCSQDGSRELDLYTFSDGDLESSELVEAWAVWEAGGVWANTHEGGVTEVIVPTVFDILKALHRLGVSHG